MSMLIIPDEISPEKLQDLIDRGTVVERAALEYMATKFDAAADALAAVKKGEAVEGLEALVVLDPDEDALVVLWRQKDEDGLAKVS
jgi:hypothetical protein